MSKSEKVASEETLGTCDWNSNEHTHNTHGPRFPCVNWKPLSPEPKKSSYFVEIDREDDGRWIAEISAQPGAIAYGNSACEAVANVMKIAVVEATPATTKEPDGMIRLCEASEKECDSWAADDRLWTTQETVKFNLRIFARKIISCQLSSLIGERDQLKETIKTLRRGAEVD